MLLRNISRSIKVFPQIRLPAAVQIATERVHSRHGRTQYLQLQDILGRSILAPHSFETFSRCHQRIGAVKRLGILAGLRVLVEMQCQLGAECGNGIFGQVNLIRRSTLSSHGFSASTRSASTFSYNFANVPRASFASGSHSFG